MAVAFVIAQRPVSFGEGSSFRHPDVFMSVFRMSARVPHRIEGAMRWFFWSGSDIARGGALVAWSTVCRPVAHGGPGVCHLQHTNMALLSKWEIRGMKPSNDMVSILFREAYGQSLECNAWATIRRGDSLVLVGIRWIFSFVQSFFRPQLGDGASF